ncbi:uncharacterized protein LOC131240648 isoform X2 [Magnolia sinica]|uniref:uncharacterized protein LOC131240648 isoform X2 n=1 Tax=Magnolia sinica TaxID=86752 RepID=UPI002659BEB1|nr:uncharacterized protein LOC131240648 isoform X2 [Magnolia sinica]
MNNLKSKKVHDFEKPFPGCMGRMVNFFDLGPGMAGNRLLTDRAHRDGAPLPRGQVHAKKVVEPNGDHIEDKPAAYESKSSSNKKSNGTPMKMLIAQEMSKETESKHQPPSVVARLMGLDGLPAQQPASTAQRSMPEGFLRTASIKPGLVRRYRHQENVLLDEQMPDFHLSQASAQEQPEYKDVGDVWQQSYVKDQPQQNGRYNENSSEKKMALVRQKFIEAKRLSTDEKLRQSKEFQDALEVLSSNRDLFLKFLQEPNSLFSKQEPNFSKYLYELQSIPPSPPTNRITVLKPSKSVEMNGCVGSDTKTEMQIKKQQQLAEENQWDKNKHSWTSSFAHQKADNSQPTRIVVLKPSPGKTHDIKAVASSPTSLPRMLHDKDLYIDAGTDESRGSREIAKEITRQMRESLSSRGDEVLVSSVLSNGYVGDESSFNRSENEYLQEENLSDSEIMTPTSRHSWDYINRYSSPYSSSSFSRASYSPESSVTREAKKRLSERLAMMTSTGNSQEQRQVRRSSSTLGEMLALPDKKNVRSGKEGNGGPSTSSSRSYGGEKELRGPLACLSGSGNREEGMEDSPRNLSRSRSVPVSSTAYGKVGLSDEVPDPKISKSIVQKEVAKPKSGKSSFKGKVSSLFFSRNKKPSKEKSVPFPSVGVQVESQSSAAGTPEILPDAKQLSVGSISGDIPECASDGGFGEGHALNLVGSSSSASILVGPKLSTCSSEAVLSLAKPRAPENASENQDQPSPISILEAPFEDDFNTPQSSENVNEDYCSEPSARLHHKSGLAAKSPLISVTRSLSWDDNVSETATTTYPLKPSSTTKPSAVASNTEEEERERFLFVQSLLSAAGLDHKKPDTVFSRWHSAASPLDPLLLEQCMDWKEEDEEQQPNEARRRKRRLDRWLLFDCVNAALVDMLGSGTDENSPGSMDLCRKSAPPGGTVAEQVWGRVREWVLGETRWFSEESETSMVVEEMVRKEVVERGWGELMRVEVDGLGREMERKLIEELLEEMLVELTCAL